LADADAADDADATIPTLHTYDGDTDDPGPNGAHDGDDDLDGTYPIETLLEMTEADLDDWERQCRAADKGDPFKQTDLQLVARARAHAGDDRWTR
jgi:hypothetical protein